MSIFDSIKGMTGGQESGDAGLMSHVAGMVNDPQSGGLMGLVQAFHANGLGGVMESWIGQGENQQIATEHIEKVIGQDRINEIASKFGMSPEDASAKLAQILPTIVDKLTPGGNLRSAA